MNIADITEAAKDIAKKYIKAGDRVVDATLGKGNDALWLSRLTGGEGRVYCFDINRAAVAAAADMLRENEARADIEFICRGHEHMAEVIHEEVAAVVFNLGYLPGGDQSITTRADTTLKGAEDALNILKKGGILIISCYRGHDEGRREDAALSEWSRELDRNRYHAVRLEMINQGEESPVLYAVNRKK